MGGILHKKMGVVDKLTTVYNTKHPQMTDNMEKKLTDFDILQHLCHTGVDTDIAMCPDFVRAQTVKKGAEITMGAGADAVTRILTGEWMPVLYLFNKQKFFEIKKKGVLPEIPTP